MKKNRMKIFYKSQDENLEDTINAWIAKMEEGMWRYSFEVKDIVVDADGGMVIVWYYIDS